MSDADDILASKMANATLFMAGEADLSRPLRGLIWVGGRVTLWPTSLMFSANRLNRWINPLFYGPQNCPALDFGVSLDYPVDLQVHPSFGMSTIELRLSDGTTIGIRCWGADELAEMIRRQLSR